MPDCCCIRIPAIMTVRCIATYRVLFYYNKLSGLDVGQKCTSGNCNGNSKWGQRLSLPLRPSANVFANTSDIATAERERLGPKLMYREL